MNSAFSRRAKIRPSVTATPSLRHKRAATKTVLWGNRGILYHKEAWRTCARLLNLLHRPVSSANWKFRRKLVYFFDWGGAFLQKSPTFDSRSKAQGLLLCLVGTQLYMLSPSSQDRCFGHGSKCQLFMGLRCGRPQSQTQTLPQEAHFRSINPVLELQDSCKVSDLLR